MTKAEYDRWKTELSNWGRWGKDDQTGRAQSHHACQAQAGRLRWSKKAFTVSLSLDANFQKGANPNAVAPYERITQAGPAGAGDRLNISYHGFLATHVDAFGHRFFDGKMYNGFSYEEVTNEDGAKRNSIHNLTKRHSDARCPDRHPPVEGCRLPSTGQPDLSGGL